MADQLLRFEPGLMIWTVIVFVITLFVLGRIAWKPLLKALDERERRIEDALTQAEKAQKEAQAAIAEAREDRAASLRRSEELVQEARAAAEAVRQRMIEEAKAESQKVVDQGLQRLEAEQRAALAEIRRMAADLAIQAANRLVRSSLDATRQREIVDDFLASAPTHPTNSVQ